MTNYPTVLGTGGHEAGGQNYDPILYFGNVGLGRCTMLGKFRTASYVTQVVRVPGNISYLSWGLDSGTFDAPLTLKLIKNGNPSILVLYIPADTSGLMTDGTDSVPVSIGDTLEFSTLVGGRLPVSYAYSFYCISARFDSTDSSTLSAQLICTVGEFSIAQTSTPEPICFLGIVADTIYAESTQRIHAPLAGTWTNMACNIENNGTDASNTITCRNRIDHNGLIANGHMAIFVSGQTTTGYFEDTTDSDSIAAGDFMNYSFTSSGTNLSNTFDLEWVGAHFIATHPDLCMIGGSVGSQNATFAGLQPGTYYSSLFGGGLPGGGGTNPQTRATGVLPYDLTASNLTFHITASTSGCAATCTLLHDGNASILTISSSAGQSGFFENISDSVAFAQGHNCANQIVVTGGSGDSITWGSATLLVQAS